MIQGGDVTDACVDPQTNRPYPGSQPGTGGASVYGEKFRDGMFFIDDLIEKECDDLMKDGWHKTCAVSR